MLHCIFTYNENIYVFINIFYLNFNDSFLPINQNYHFLTPYSHTARKLLTFLLFTLEVKVVEISKLFEMVKVQIEEYKYGNSKKANTK